MLCSHAHSGKKFYLQIYDGEFSPGLQIINYSKCLLDLHMQRNLPGLLFLAKKVGSNGGYNITRLLSRAIKSERGHSLYLFIQPSPPFIFASL